MSHCLNPTCNSASNPPTAKFCQRCGSVLLIQERYRALRVIGQGGFGKTFLAQDEGKPSKPRCVIKQFFYNDPGSASEAMRLFDEEAVRLDDLGKHPQIPELLAHAEHEGRKYLIQEYIDGENLEQELSRTGAFREAQIRALLSDLLPVLDFIHKHNVIHRDIKPENILRRRSDGKLVLVDFGAAKHATMTLLAKTGTSIGDPRYMAPEQTRGKALPASDLYGLGVTCLHLLTNVDPVTLYDAIDGFAWRDYLVDNPVSDGFGKVLDALTQHNAKDRYKSVDEVMGALGIHAPSSQAKQPVASQQGAQIAATPTATPTTRMQPQAQVTGSGLVLQLPRGATLELVRVPAGRFLMGAPQSEKNSSDWERPQHWVDVSEFFMGKYPVTQAQYEAVMGQNPSHFKGADRPVEQVSWHDAQVFCKKLSQLTGKRYRLPSEAEWEYACRAESQGEWCFGDDENQLKDYAWYDYNSRKETHPVGQKRPNAWGLYDMHGNVWEWCEDVWHNSYNGAPTNGRAWVAGGDSDRRVPSLISAVYSYLFFAFFFAFFAWVAGGDSDRRVLRGGSWYLFAINCRSAFRSSSSADFQDYGLGFRVVLSSS